MNALSDPSLTVQLQISLPPNHPPMVRFMSEPDEEIPLQEAVSRVAEIVSSRSRVIVETEIEGRRIIDEFVDPLTTDNPLRSTSTPTPEEFEPLDLPHKPSSHGESELAPPHRTSSTMKLAAALVALTGITLGCAAIFIANPTPHSRSPQNKVTTWAAPQQLAATAVTHKLGDPQWSTNVTPEATLVATSLGVVAIKDQTFTVTDPQGKTSPNLKLGSSPTLVAVVEVDETPHIALVEEKSIRLWTPAHPADLTTVALPPAATVTTTGGTLLVVSDKKTWTVRKDTLVPVKVPKVGHLISMSPTAFIAVVPPASIITQPFNGTQQKVNLTGIADAQLQRWVGVTNQFVLVIWQDHNGPILAVHSLATGQAKNAVRVSKSVATDGVYRNDADNRLATFAHLLVDLESGTIVAESEPEEPFTALTFGAAFAEVNGAGEWCALDGKNYRIPTGHTLLAVNESTVITRTKNHIQAWKLNQ
ncbi:MAG: hypothetical protein GX678_04105 [Actinomycetales bacterium]|nr:hypothetical protein [Actinomycetales bacterium]